MTLVVKLGGRVQSDPALVTALEELWNSEPGSFCVVHGGGDEISRLQRQMGREPSFVKGRRITTAEDLDLIRMVLSGSANKRLVSALGAAGLPAVGISGEDGGLLSAVPIDEQRFGRAGKPTTANVELIRTLLGGGFLPVVSPVAGDALSRRGEALNVNGDDAAAAIAGALAGELLLLADVPGVMDRDSRPFPSIDPLQMESLVSDGTVTAGMHAKLEAGFAALAAGASSVRISGLKGLSSQHAGTLLSLTPIMK